MRNHKKERCVFESFCLNLAPAGTKACFNFAQVSCQLHTHMCGHTGRTFLTYMHSHTYMHTHTRICMYVCAYTHLYAHTCTHICP